MTAERGRTARLALVFGAERAALKRRDGGRWTVLAELSLDVEDLGAAMAPLQRRAAQEDPEGPHVLLCLPPDHVRHLLLERPAHLPPGADPRPFLAPLLAGQVPVPVSELRVAVRDDAPEGGRLAVTLADIETLREAEVFVRARGFVPVGAVGPEHAGAGPGSPWFGLSYDQAPFGVAEGGLAPVVPGLSMGPPMAGADAPARPDAGAHTGAAPRGGLPAEERVHRGKGAPAPRRAAPGPMGLSAVEANSRRIAEALARLAPADPDTFEEAAGGAAAPAPEAPRAARRQPASKARRRVDSSRPGRRALISATALTAGLVAGLAAVALWVEATPTGGRDALTAAPEELAASAAPPGLDLAAIAESAATVEAARMAEIGLTTDPLAGPAQAEAADPAARTAGTPDPAAPRVIARAAPRAEPPPALAADLRDAPVPPLAAARPDAPPTQPDSAARAGAAPGGAGAPLPAASAPGARFTADPLLARPIPLPSLDALVQPGLDAVVSTDAFAIPAAPPPPQVELSLDPPPEAGRRFAVDTEGLVRPTPEGAEAPAGHRVVAGLPPLMPGRRPATAAAAAVAEATAAAEAPVLGGVDDALRLIRPRGRPGDLTDRADRQRLGGRTRAELSSLKPDRRTPSPQEVAAADPGRAALIAPIAGAPAPAARPAGLRERAMARAAAPAEAPPSGGDAARVASASLAGIASAPRAPALAAPPAAAPAPARAAATATAVVRQPRNSDRIDLSRMNLLGTFGSPTRPRAMVRLPSGRVLTLTVGDNVDGGRVAAIGQGELRYTKRGQNIILRMPRG